MWGASIPSRSSNALTVGCLSELRDRTLGHHTSLRHPLHSTAFIAANLPKPSSTPDHHVAAVHGM
jgi:hypothetical protein